MTIFSINTIDISKPVWKVRGKLSDMECIRGDVGCRITSFVNAIDEASAFTEAKKEWPEGTEFTSAHEIDPSTGLKKNGS